MMVLIRAFPSGTAGKAIPAASNSFLEKSIVARPSPTMMGVMGVSLAGVLTPPILNPASASCCLKYRSVPHPGEARVGQNDARATISGKILGLRTNQPAIIPK